MSSLRTALLSLPFVAQNPDGTLDLWAVRPSGDERTDVETGRSHFAWFLHIMREHDAAHMLLHISEAWHAQQNPEDSRHIKEGWTFEMAEAIRAAPENNVHLMSVTSREFPGTLRESALSLPFVTVRYGGGLHCFSADYSGGFEVLQARGRFYAALTAQYLRKTGHPSFLTWLALDVDPAQRGSPLRVGFLSVLSEIAASSPRRCTTHAEAMYPFFVRERDSVPTIG